MTNIINDISSRKLAVLGGIGYLVIFFTGFFSNFAVLEGMVVPGDTANTLSNIQNNGMMFRLGLLSFFIMVIIDVLMAWVLYVLLIPVNRNLSLLTGWLRLVNGAIFGAALFNLLDILYLAGESGPAGAEQQVMLAITGFNNTWLVGLVFFGLHLLFLGYLAYRSGFIPRVIGTFLIVAGTGYLVDSFANFMLPDYADYKDVFTMIVVIPGVVGELSLTIWLLVKGGKKFS